jgi:uncharacterized protein YndB with AHSA1/START domain
MPRNRDLKRLVRTRMTKTGESYTAARAQIIRKSKPKSSTRSAGPAIDYANVAGMSDDAVKAKTGCTWERWVRSLDHDGAAELSHREIAKLIHEKYKIGSWWTQMVAVGYERIKGLRGQGQQRDGSFGATKSRTYNVPIGVLFEAWTDASIRNRWLDGAAVKIRTATAPKSLRLDWREAGGTLDGIVAVGFFTKGGGKSSVALEHTKLPDRGAVNRLKAYWTARLDALQKVLEAPED